MSEKNENKQKQAGVGPLKKFYSKNVNTVAIEKTYSADFMIKNANKNNFSFSRFECILHQIVKLFAKAREYSHISLA